MIFLSFFYIFQIKEKLAATGAINHTCQSTELLIPDPETPISERLEPLPRKSSKKSVQEEERLLSTIAAREEQSIAFQTRVLEMLAPTKANERTTYADWAKEVMINIHPSLWLRFQRECTNLLYTYQEKTEDLLRPKVAQQQQFAFTPQPPIQRFPRSDSGLSLNNMWQPPPNQWPTSTSIQPTMSGWGSQNSPWVQAQVTDNQHLMTTSSGPLPTMLPMGSSCCADSQPEQQVFSLGKVIRETIGTPESLSECDVTTQSE